MKIAERIVMVALLLSLVGGGVWLYVSVRGEQQEVREAVARGEYEISVATVETSTSVPVEEWRTLYPNTVPVKIGEVVVEASVADTLPERIQGLSDTPFLPENVVKLFAFGAPGLHSIWMKDMQYPLDILWAAEDGTIVHIEENVSPDTYSKENPRASRSFESPTPAWYVIEANAGFVASSTIKIGDKVILE
jgi:hypothetical protein